MRLSEIYTSIQGEGPGIGRPTTFVRFAGCNLRCPGWPCDTQHAIDPQKYRHEWETLPPNEVYSRIRDVNTNGRVTLTGGEPFLQPQDELVSLVDVYMRQYQIEVFTNGTLAFDDWVQQQRVTVIMDWKLPGSGEDGYLNTRLKNLGMLTNKDAVKFVCVDRDDFETAWNLTVNEYPELFQYIGHIYIGAAWGKVTEAEVAGWLIESGHDLELNVQMHNYIWPRDQRGT